jgi:hypothetical protein
MTASRCGRRTRFDRARRLAAQTLGQLARGDRAAVLTFTGRALGRDGPAGVELSPDPARLVSDLEALEPTLGAGDPFAALAEAVRLFDSPRQRVRLLVVLSDLQSGAWPQSPWPQPREAVPAVLVQVGPPARANVVASSVRLGEATAVAGRPNTLEVRLANHGAATAAAELIVEMDGKRCAHRPVQLAGRSEAVERVPLVFEGEAAQPGFALAESGGSAPPPAARLRRIRVHLAGPDALPEDNTLFATVETARRLPVLLVHGPLADEPRRSPAFYVRTALGAVVADGSQLPVDMAAEGDLGSAGLQAYRVVVLAGVRNLPAAEAERLENYVEAGGGLLVFLGDGADPDFYNRVLGSADRPRGGIMPARLQGLVTSEGRPEPMHIIQAEWDHAVFERFQGPLRSALAAIDVRRAWRVEPRDAFVLARLDAAVPLVLERAYGRGRVLLVTAPPQPDWTNLPLRRNFIALASRMVSYLAGGGALGADHEVGRELVVASGAEAARGVRVTRPGPAPMRPGAADAKPGRQVVEARLRAVGARPEAYLDAADVSVPGFYEVAVGGAAGLRHGGAGLRPGGAGTDAPRVAAVNCPRSESDPEVLDLDLARRFGGRWKVEGVDLAEAPDRTAADTQAALAKVLGSGHLGRGIWDTLMWAVLAALVIEPFIANRVGGRRARRTGAADPLSPGGKGQAQGNRKAL